MTRAERLLQSLWPWRWWRAAWFAVTGVRQHPTAVLLGRRRQFRFDGGAVLGARVSVDAGQAGAVHLGRGVWLGGETVVQTDTLVSLSEGSTVQQRCHIHGTVRIGRGCLFAPNVFISSGSHPFREVPHLPIREQERLLAAQGAAVSPDRPVWIQDDCWLGVNVVVSPGVTIGKGSVIGANAVVTHNVLPYSVMAGVPAREIGRRLAWAPRDRVDMSSPQDRVYVLAGAEPFQAGSGVEVRAGEPFVVAIRPSAGRVLVRYRAHSAMEISAGNETRRLERGEGSVELPAQALMQAGGEEVIGLSLSVCTISALLEVLEISST